MISTQQITYILAVSDTRSFSRAANECFVTQPTLSMQIKKAEETLGFPVFYRDVTKCDLTEFGQALLPVLRQIHGDLSAIRRLCEQFSETYRERLRIGVIPTVACYLLQDCFTEWQGLFPKTKLDIDELKSARLVEALEMRKIDLAILAGPVEDDHWRTTPLYEEEILAYFPRKKQKTVSVDELQLQQPWLLNKGNCLRTQMMRFCSLHDENESAAWNYAGSNIDMLLRMADTYGGYTLVPTYYTRFFEKQKPAFKTIRNQAGQSPGRSIVAVNAYRHANWDSLKKLIRSIQLRYGGTSSARLELLNWK